jgi:hypothetical protein
METEDLIDRSLRKIIGLSLDEFRSFKSTTVADTLAHSLITAANQGDMKALTIVADRAGGRATQKKEIVRDTEAALKLSRMLKGEK